MMAARASALLIAWTALMAAFTGFGLADDSFVAGFEDLPLMDKLAPVDDAGIVFDTPGGRIVESYASGKVSPDAVARFYRETLPALGWVETAPLTFVREGESLGITVEEADDPGTVTVLFALAPI
jgi:hypothetical protein